MQVKTRRRERSREAPDPEKLIWTSSIPGEQWEVYRGVLDATRAAGIPFALGGAFALATYTGEWRNTKDLDIYVLPRDRDAMVELLERQGLEDYHDTMPYDRAWIYRGYRDPHLVDVIWSMANQRAQVDERWLDGGPEIAVRGDRVRVIPPEELLWSKLYVMQKDRCDWPDVLNLIFGAGGRIDWDHLVARMGDDWPLLQGVLSVYSWLCPARAATLPRWLLEERPGGGRHESAPDPERVRLLDTRPWFRLGMAAA